MRLTVCLRLGRYDRLVWYTNSVTIWGYTKPENQEGSLTETVASFLTTTRTGSPFLLTRILFELIGKRYSNPGSCYIPQLWPLSESTCDLYMLEERAVLRVTNKRLHFSGNLLSQQHLIFCFHYEGLNKLGRMRNWLWCGGSDETGCGKAPVNISIHFRIPKLIFWPASPIWEHWKQGHSLNISTTMY